MVYSNIRVGALLKYFDGFGLTISCNKNIDFLPHYIEFKFLEKHFGSATVAINYRETQVFHAKNSSRETIFKLLLFKLLSK